MGNKESTKTKKVTEVFELSDETIELLAHSTNLAKPVIIDWHKQFLLDCPGYFSIKLTKICLHLIRIHFND
jgi:hypothetical protein